MKRLNYIPIFIFSSLVFFSGVASAQIINTVAGGAYFGYGGDGGLAIDAGLSYPTWVSLDTNDNLYIVDGSTARIRMVNTAGIISTFAGVGSLGYEGDGGPATSAKINQGVYAPPASGGIYAAAGNLYIDDSWNNVIRMVNDSGIITTIACTGTGGFGGDGGLAIHAKIDSAAGICVDVKGNIYIADINNQRIRKIDTLGIIHTIAGNGTAGDTGMGGPATAAELNNPIDVKTDRWGTVFVLDAGNYRVCKIDTFGIITIVAGNDTNGYSGDGGPATAAKINNWGGIALDGVGNLFIAGNTTVRKVDMSTGIITTIAGINDSNGFAGDGGPATEAQFSEMEDAQFDKHGNLYIADAAHTRIRMIAGAGAPVPGATDVPNVVNTAGNSIALLPNPNNGEFTVKGVINGLTNERVMLEIINVLGQAVYMSSCAVQQGAINQQIHAGNLNNGVYMVRINSGKIQLTSRFVVEK